MSLVHQASQPGTLSNLDVFKLKTTQVAVDYIQVDEQRPLNNITSEGPVEFIVPGEADSYIDLAQTQFYVSLKIVKRDGTNLDAHVDEEHPGSRVAPVNLLLHSLWSQVDVQLNDRLITPSSNTYAYKSYLETLLTYGPDAKKTHLEQSLFFKDEAGKLDDNDPTRNNANSALRKRYALIDSSRPVELLGRVHVDAFTSDKLLLSNVDVKLKFTRNSDDFCLMSSEARALYKIKIVDAKLYVRRVHVAPTIQMSHNRVLEKSNAKYNFTKTDVKVINIPAGTRSLSKDNLFLGELPKRIIMGLVADSAMSGNIGENPFNFKHYDLIYVAMSVSGRAIPSQPLRPNFQTGEYARSYMTLFSGCGGLFKDHGFDISRLDYGNGYTIYAFDIAPGAGDDETLSLIRKGNFKIELGFRVATPHTVNLLIYSEFDDVIEISKERKVLMDG
jgi:hypothetical protein